MKPVDVLGCGPTQSGSSYVLFKVGALRVSVLGLERSIRESVLTWPASQTSHWWDQLFTSLLVSSLSDQSLASCLSDSLDLRLVRLDLTPDWSGHFRLTIVLKTTIGPFFRHLIFGQFPVGPPNGYFLPGASLVLSGFSFFISCQVSHYKVSARPFVGLVSVRPFVSLVSVRRPIFSCFSGLPVFSCSIQVSVLTVFSTLPLGRKGNPLPSSGILAIPHPFLLNWNQN
jgi:hypothetical protein